MADDWKEYFRKTSNGRLSGDRAAPTQSPDDWKAGFVASSGGRLEPSAAAPVVAAPQTAEPPMMIRAANGQPVTLTAAESAPPEPQGNIAQRLSQRFGNWMARTGTGRTVAETAAPFVDAETLGAAGMHGIAEDLPPPQSTGEAIARQTGKAAMTAALMTNVIPNPAGTVAKGVGAVVGGGPIGIIAGVPGYTATENALTPGQTVRQKLTGALRSPIDMVTAMKDAPGNAVHIATSDAPITTPERVYETGEALQPLTSLALAETAGRGGIAGRAEGIRDRIMGRISGRIQPEATPVPEPQRALPTPTRVTPVPERLALPAPPPEPGPVVTPIEYDRPQLPAPKYLPTEYGGRDMVVPPRAEPNVLRIIEQPQPDQLAGTAERLNRAPIPGKPIEGGRFEPSPAPSQGEPARPAPINEVTNEGVRNPAQERPMARGANVGGEARPLATEVSPVVRDQGKPAGDQPGNVAALTDQQRAFIENRVAALGNFDAVDKAYQSGSPVGDYARDVARQMYSTIRPATAAPEPAAQSPAEVTRESQTQAQAPAETPRVLSATESGTTPPVAEPRREPAGRPVSQDMAARPGATATSVQPPAGITRESARATIEQLPNLPEERRQTFLGEVEQYGDEPTLRAIVAEATADSQIKPKSAAERLRERMRGRTKGVIRGANDVTGQRQGQSVEQGSPPVDAGFAGEVPGVRAGDAAAGRELRPDAASGHRGTGEEVRVPERVLNEFEKDIPLSLATQAHEGTSMVPEKRGHQRVAEYVEHLTKTRKWLESLAKSPEQKAIVESEFQRYRSSYAAKTREWLSAQGRVMSTMITGPSNFPTERNRKRGDTADRRLNELIDFSKRARASMAKAIEGARTPDQVQSDEATRLKREVDDAVETVTRIRSGELRGFDSSAWTQSLPGKLERSAKNGNVEAVQAALDHLREKQAGMKRPVFTDRNAIWKLGEVAEQTVANQKTGTDFVGDYEGASIERDHAAERVRINFDAKPSPAVITELKARGWKWSRQNEAWQRMNTDASVASAKNILDRFYEAKEQISGQVEENIPTNVREADGAQGNDAAARPVAVGGQGADEAGGSARDLSVQPEPQGAREGEAVGRLETPGAQESNSGNRVVPPGPAAPGMLFGAQAGKPTGPKLRDAIARGFARGLRALGLEQATKRLVRQAPKSGREILDRVRFAYDKKARFEGMWKDDLRDVWSKTKLADANNAVLSYDGREQPKTPEAKEITQRLADFDRRFRQALQDSGIRMMDRSTFRGLDRYMPQRWNETAKADVDRGRGAFYDKAVTFLTDQFKKRNLQYVNEAVTDRPAGETPTPAQLQGEVKRFLRDRRMAYAKRFTRPVPDAKTYDTEYVDLITDFMQAYGKEYRGGKIIDNENPPPREQLRKQAIDFIRHAAKVEEITGGTSFDDLLKAGVVRDIQLHRLFQWPREFLVDDLRQAWFDHVGAASRVVARQSAFGFNANVLNALARRYVNEVGERAVEGGKQPQSEAMAQAEDFLRQFTSDILGHKDPRQRHFEAESPTLAKILPAARTVAAVGQIGPGSTYSLGGNLILGFFTNAYRNGLMSTIRGAAVTKGRVREAQRSGATSYEFVPDMLEASSLPTRAKRMLSGWYTAQESVIRASAAMGGWDRANRVAARLSVSPEIDPLESRFGRELRDFGLSDEQVIAAAKAGKIPDNLQGTVYRNAVDNSQPMSRPMDSPHAWSGPYGRLITQYWPAWYQTAQNTIGHALREAGYGNLIPIARLIPMAVAAGWLYKTLGDTIAGNKPPKDEREKLARWLQIVTNPLGLDTPFKVLGPGHFGGLKEMLTPAAIGFADSLIGNAVDAGWRAVTGKGGKPIDALRRALRSIAAYRAGETLVRKVAG